MAIHINARPIVTDNLIFFIDSYNNKSYTGSGTNVTDLMNNKLCTMVNGVGYVDNTWTFDGFDDYIQAVNLGLSSTSFTLSGWIKSSLAEIDGLGTFIGYNGTRRILIKKDGRLLAQFNGNFFSNYNKIKANTWHHIAYVFDLSGSTEYFYIDGEYDSERTNGSASWDASFKIGQYNLHDYKLDGGISQVMIYDRNLSADEIKQNYESSKPRFR